MRRSFYLFIGSLALCGLALVSESEVATKPSGEHIDIDLDLADQNLKIHRHLPFSGSEKESRTKNSPFVCNHPILEDIDFNVEAK